MEDEVWMTVKDATLFTGASVQTVYSWKLHVVDAGDEGRETPRDFRGPSGRP